MMTLHFGFVKKFLVKALFCAIVMNSVICAASIPNEQTALGGICFGNSPEYVKSIYGEPGKIVKKDHSAYFDGPVYTYAYGSSFNVDINDNRVVFVSTTEHNGIATPAGVEVGMPYSVLNDIYGAPTNISRDPKTKKVSMYYYGSYRSKYVGLRFDIANNGKIIRIGTGLFD